MTIHLPGKPEKFFPTAGIGTGDTRLTAFDKALLNAGVGNYNLVQVSSIVPVEAKIQQKIDLQEGSLLPIAYGYSVTSEPGIRVTAAIAVVIPESGTVGLIMEYSGNLPEEEAREMVKSMGIEALKNRNTTAKEIIVKSASTVCIGHHWTCAFAGVALW